MSSPAPWSRATVRRLLAELLATDSDLAAFCGDHFPEVAARFTNGLDRVAKVNLLLDLAEPGAIARALEAYAPDSYHRRVPPTVPAPGSNPYRGLAAFQLDEAHLFFGREELCERLWKRCQAIAASDSEPRFLAILCPSGAGKSSGDKTVRVWDADSGKTLRVLQGHAKSVAKASFSPDGRRIVSASEDRTVRVWDTDSGEALRVLQGHADEVFSASFSADGRRIVSASKDKTVRVWDTDSGEVLRVLQGHAGEVFSASFSPDGLRIVSASGDKTVRVWDTNSGENLRVLRGHTDFVIDARFSPDGHRIVSADGAGTLLIWNVTPEERGPEAIGRLIDCWAPLKLDGDVIVPRMSNPAACQPPGQAAR